MRNWAILPDEKMTATILNLTEGSNPTLADSSSVEHISRSYLQTHNLCLQAAIPRDEYAKSGVVVTYRQHGGL
jgi:hypothetical protein